MLKRIILCCTLATVALPAAAQICVRHIVVPEYPYLARLAYVTGSVHMTIQVRPDGTVATATATEKDNTAFKFLVDESEKNVRQWLFCSSDPSSEAHTLTITYNYKLEEPATYYPHVVVVMDLPESVQITTQRPLPM